MPKRTGGDPLRLAFCWAQGRKNLIKAQPKKGSTIVDEALLRIAALYKIDDGMVLGRHEVPKVLTALPRLADTASSPVFET